MLEVLGAGGRGAEATVLLEGCNNNWVPVAIANVWCGTGLPAFFVLNKLEIMKLTHCHSVQHFNTTLFVCYCSSQYHVLCYGVTPNKSKKRRNSFNFFFEDLSRFTIYIKNFFLILC